MLEVCIFYGFETNLSPFLLVFLAARALTNSGFAATTSRMFTKLAKVIFILLHCQASEYKSFTRKCRWFSHQIRVLPPRYFWQIFYTVCSKLMLLKQPQTNMRQCLLPPPMTGPWLYHLQRWNEVGKKPQVQHWTTEQPFKSTTDTGYLPSAQAFCQYTLPERFPPGQWTSFQKYLRLARLLQTIMKCLQKKCFRITRCVRRENIIIASLLLLFSVKMIMCRGVPELHIQRVLDRLMQMELFVD